MRLIACIASAIFLMSWNARAQPASGPDGLACFENLSAPEYPRTALQAGVDGSIWTTVHVSAQRTVEKIDTEVVSSWSEAPKLLVPAVEKAVRAASIQPACAGKAVRVVFRYHLTGDPQPEPKVTSRTDAPYLLWIESQPATPPNARTKS